MKKHLVLAAIAGLAAAPLAAQRAWQSEIGIQGGYSIIKPAGSGQDDKIKAFDLPGSSFLLGILTSAPVYAVIPWKNKVAIEPSFGISTTSLGTDISLVTLGIRADYALSKDFYAAAGGVFGYFNASSQNVRQLGVTAAAGYRRHLVGPLNGRLEASATFRKKTTDLGPLNAYSVLLGVSTRTGGGSAARPARRGAARSWEPAIGVQGGYASIHSVGGAFAASSFSLPGYGGSAEALGIPIGGPPSLFAIFPVGTKMAIEPGLDIRHIDQPASSSAINASARLDYAVRGGWYGAVGATMTNVNPAAVAAKWIPGATVAWGVRFPLSGAFGGRAELNYNMRKKSEDLGLPPINIFAFSIGATVPLH
jgi:hypothetical protein